MVELKEHLMVEDTTSKTANDCLKFLIPYYRETKISWA